MSSGKKGSHPPTLIRIVERTLDQEIPTEPGQKLLLAVSGGGDSTALLHVMAGLGTARGLVLHAHGIDHGLRPEAPAELDLAESLATTLNVPFSRSSVALGPGGNLQAKARDLRYRALRLRAAELGGARIVTAHHANDRAETVLLRLLRGAGVEGLGVLGAAEGDLVRPFLRATREDIELHLKRHALEFASDPSNKNAKYTRVRVRRELLPLLQTLSPSIVQQLCNLADEAIGLRERNGSDGTAVQPLGRKQRVALESAIERGQLGFQLPINARLRIVLEENK